MQCNTREIETTSFVPRTLEDSEPYRMSVNTSHQFRAFRHGHVLGPQMIPAGQLLQIRVPIDGGLTAATDARATRTKRYCVGDFNTMIERYRISELSTCSKENAAVLVDAAALACVSPL